MRKLTINHRYTQVSYLAVDDMKVETMEETFDGKVNFKDIVNYLNEHDKPYVNGSFTINYIDEGYQIPYNVLEELLCASINWSFLRTEKDDASVFEFGKKLYIKSYVSPLNLNKVEIVPKEVATFKDENTGEIICLPGYCEVTGIVLQCEVLEYIKAEYSV